MGNLLDTPITTKEGERYVSSTGIEVGASGMQGFRLEMEDDHIAIDIPSRPDHLFLAVFDGHAGAGAAHYSAKHMVRILENTAEWKQYLQEDTTSNMKLLGEAMAQTFLKIDQELRPHQEGTNGQDTSGCTSVTAIVTPTHILCANAGDSRCVMGTGSTAKPLSEDHKPLGDSEKARILEAGGFVQWNRVDGELAVSRGLGDFSYKNIELQPHKQKVTCCPDITVHQRTAQDDVLLLACDGLWDVMSTEEAVATIREIYASGEQDVLKVAEEMLDLSLDKGSKDNISAVVVKLPGAKIGPASNGGVEKRRADRQKLRQQQRQQE